MTDSIKKPSQKDCVNSLMQQFNKYERGLHWVGESLARFNRDILLGDKDKEMFLEIFNYSTDCAINFLAQQYKFVYNKRTTLLDLVNRLDTNNLKTPCQIFNVDLEDVYPHDEDTIEQIFISIADEAFTATSGKNMLVEVSGIFNFFAKRLGSDWLRWWKDDRAKKWGRSITPRDTGITFSYQSDYFLWQEARILRLWRDTIHKQLMRLSNFRQCPCQYTGITEESQSKGLLLHRWYEIHKFPRQETVIDLAKRNDIDVVIDQDGSYLIPIPRKQPLQIIADQQIDPLNFSCAAIFDWLMQVQNNYSTYNTITNIPIRESEITEIGKIIYNNIQNNNGYAVFNFYAHPGEQSSVYSKGVPPETNYQKLKKFYEQISLLNISHLPI